MLFGAYPTDADGTVQPILWRVLKTENGEAYLLSEYILFGAPVHGDYEHYQGWENSDLYRYLNTVFLQDAFTPEEQAALLILTEDQALVTLITSDEWSLAGNTLFPLSTFVVRAQSLKKATVAALSKS